MWIKKALLFLLVITMTTSVTGQYGSIGDTAKVYHLNKWWSLGIIASGATSNYFGVQRLISKDRITTEDLQDLTRDKVPSFDRIALDQNPDQQDALILWSDIVSLGSVGAAGFLFFDDEIRKDWLNITLMYFETQMLSSNVYSWGPFGPQWINRIRPWAYYDEFSFEERTTGKKRNSFFSGHTSSTATANFFMAKVYCDYHPELGRKKWIPYALAALPTATVAILRVKSLNHFPSDVFAGAVIGAGMGILIPEIHRRMNVRIMARYDEDFKGVGMSWNLK